MQTATINKWGNAQAVRLPADICKRLSLSAGDTISLEIVKGTIVLSPTKPKLPNTIQERIKFWDGIRDSAGEIDWGSPVGKEIFAENEK